MSYIVRVLDGGGQVAGWIAVDDQITPVAWEAREFATRAAADEVRARLAAQFGLPDEYGLGEVDVQELPPTLVEGHRITRLGRVGRGDTVLVHSLTGWLDRDELATLRARIAEQVGHDEFGITVTTRSVEALEVVDGRTMAELGWVFVGTPGCCPSCGSDDVVVHADRIPARRCGRCGHTWNEYHARSTAA